MSSFGLNKPFKTHQSSWKEPKTKNHLENRIMKKTKATKGIDLLRYDITDEMLLEEYTNIWLQCIRNKDKINMLYNHPDLRKKDFEWLDSKVRELRDDKFKHALYGLLGCMTIYNLTMRNYWFFYNGFNKKPWTRFPIARRLKKFGYCVLIYYGFFFSFNYFYNQNLVLDAKSEGLFEKYNLEFYFNTETE